MSLEELLAIEVTSVSKKAESRLEAASAVVVISQEDIRRSGVTTLVAALALAPGVEVSRINSSQWALGIRGFQSRLSRAVLVLIDGRSVYTPLFAGVYWEAQDTLLEDVERIEVIRGPGATLWGANAVNGVINIITKKSSETQGSLVAAAGGTEDRLLLGARHGGTIGKTSYRVYGKQSNRDAQFNADGQDDDAWHSTQAGFRTDTPVASGLLTMQGDAYRTKVGERTTVTYFEAPYLRSVTDDGHLAGMNLLGRFVHTRADQTQLSVQTYVDHTQHSEIQYREDRTTLDLEVSDRLLLPWRQELSWGVGFRSSRSDTDSIPTLVFSPARRTERLYSAFLQNEITILPDRLRLTVGTKVEHNDYTGFEVQPSARLVLLPGGAGHALWAAVSRAVRTPSRVEFDVSKSTGASATQPLFIRLTGDGGFVSEEVIAYEAGYRAQLGARLQLDVAAFYNDLSNFTTGEQTGPPFAEGQGSGLRFVLPFAFRNGLAGKARGIEVLASFAPVAGLELRAGYAYLSLDLDPRPGSTDLVSGPNIEGSSPRHSGLLSVHGVLSSALTADATLRYVDRLPTLGVKSRWDLSAQIAWEVLPGLALSAIGQGLFYPHRLEFGAATEIQRAVLGRATWTF